MNSARPPRPTVIEAAVSALAVRGLALALTFGFTVALGRFAGPGGAGDYYLVATCVHVLAVLGRVGLDNAVLRFVAEERERGSAAIEGVLRQALRLGALPTVVLAAAFFFAAPALARAFGEPQISGLFELGSIAVVPLALALLMGEALKGVERPASAQLVQSLAVPATLLVMFMLSTGRGAADAVRAQVLGAWLALALGCFAWYSHGEGTLRGALRFPVRRLLATSIPLLFVSSMLLVNSWADTILLAVFHPQQEVGRYGISFRLAGLLTIPLIVVNGVVAPRIVRLFRQGNTVACSRLARRSALGVGALAAPMLALLVSAPEWCLGIFGNGFPVAAPTLTVLAFAYYFNVLSGSVAQILAVTGHERVLLAANVAMALLNLLLNLLLIPPYGTLGAALGTGATIVLSNVILLAYLRQRLGIRVLL